MKKLLLLLCIGLSTTSIAQTSCADAVIITTNGITVCPAIVGTHPTGTGLCFTPPASNPRANWYKFTPTQNGTLTVASNIAANPSTGANAIDTRLSILTGNCASSYSCIASNDDIDDPNSDYRSRVSNITVNSGTTYYIVWDSRWQATSFSFELTFTAQTCFKPTSYTFTANPTTTTASIGWTAPVNGVPTGYQFEYGVQGFVQGTGTTINPTPTVATLTGLIPATVYDFYVRTNCGAGNFSVWDGPITFNTVFPSSSVPYNTSFENTQFGYLGWFAGTTNTDWFINAGATLAQNGTSAAVALSNTTAVSAQRLYSRGINLTANSQATINYFVRNYVAGTPISTNTSSYVLSVGNGPLAASQTTILATETNISSATYLSKSFTFTPTTTGTYFFGFLHNSPANSAGVHGMFLDNFTVTQVLSTDSFISNKFSISPNPTSDFVNINSSENIGVNSVSIADLNGRIVKEISYNNLSNIQVNVSDLSSGMYLMSIKSEQGTATKKILKN